MRKAGRDGGEAGRDGGDAGHKDGGVGHEGAEARTDDGTQGRAMSRRMLLTVGGITLLAGCTATPAEHIADAARTRPRQSRSPGSPAPGHGTPGTGAPGTGAPGTGAPGTGAPGTPGTGTTGTTGTHIGRPEFYVNAGPKAIALTIDDGPSLTYTPQILRLLAQYQVTATFSMIGRQVVQLPGIARDVAAAGHQIANHTWRHRDLQALGPQVAVAEIDRATDAIQNEIGITPRYFRAPFGAWSPTVLRHCAAAGLTPLDWSVDPRDWARPGVSYITQNIMRHTRTGSIILEHDGGGNRSQTVAALRIVIPRLLEAGYRFTTP